MEALTASSGDAGVVCGRAVAVRTSGSGVDWAAVVGEKFLKRAMPPRRASAAAHRHKTSTTIRTMIRVFLVEGVIGFPLRLSISFGGGRDCGVEGFQRKS